MNWYISEEDLYVFTPIIRCEDVVVTEIFSGFYEVTPLQAGAFVSIKEGERFRVFVFSGVNWVTE